MIDDMKYTSVYNSNGYKKWLIANAELYLVKCVVNLGILVIGSLVMENRA